MIEIGEAWYAIAPTSQADASADGALRGHGADSGTEHGDGQGRARGERRLPPQGPGHFFPYFTQARVGGVCLWEFGNMRNGNAFGGDAQYGAVGPGTLGAFAGPVRANPNC